MEWRSTNRDSVVAEEITATGVTRASDVTIAGRWGIGNAIVVHHVARTAEEKATRSGTHSPAGHRHEFVRNASEVEGGEEGGSGEESDDFGVRVNN